MTRNPAPFQQVRVEQLRERASRPGSSLPRPFLRWVGSKRGSLPHIVEVLPSRFRTYWEPFLGSGSLFFLLQPEHAGLSDTCEELIACFEAIRDSPQAVTRFLRPLRPERELFYAVRRNRSHGRYKHAAEFIFLNKACWNGLYRVNLRGIFNVPYGWPKSEGIFDEENLRRCSQTLSGANIRLSASDFEVALQGVAEGDLVFLDPPYVTSHSDNGFIEYNERIFSWADQLRLARTAREMVDRGASVIVTNANHADVLAMYPGFGVKNFERHSTLASDVKKRGSTVESIIYCTNSLHGQINEEPLALRDAALARSPAGLRDGHTLGEGVAGGGD